jgi:hypothetical protein
LAPFFEYFSVEVMVISFAKVVLLQLWDLRCFGTKSCLFWT